MKKITLYILALLVAFSCDEKAEYDQTLGLFSAYNSLSESGGSTQVAVFSNTDWTVEFDHPVTWASIDRFSGHKSGYLVFDYDVNYGRSRRVKLIFKAGGETRTMSMYQNARFADNKCTLRLTSSTIVVEPEGLENKEIEFETNLIYNLSEMFLSVTYPEGKEPETPWINLVSVEKDKVTITVAPNTTGENRIANIRISHTDAGSLDSEEGNTIDSNSITVAQKK